MRRGDAAVRAMSIRIDNWDRKDYRLSEAEIRECLAQVSARDLEDIRFAQAQIRHFAELHRAALKDVEVETLPCSVLGHRNIPVASIGSYVPGSAGNQAPPRSRSDGAGRGQAPRRPPGLGPACRGSASGSPSPRRRP